ncbi:MAG: hypothetical protein GY749_41890 [Desulfobacteraceae bacterium]|nr:hypothetical protein [Desulfobacteraceae bacterium]
MEKIEVSEENDEFESPEWHKKALAETERRLKDGKEEVIDWTEAKRQLSTLPKICNKKENVIQSPAATEITAGDC